MVIISVQWDELELVNKLSKIKIIIIRSLRKIGKEGDRRPNLSRGHVKTFQNGEYKFENESNYHPLHITGS